MCSYKLPEEIHNGKIFFFHGVCIEIYSWSGSFQKQELIIKGLQKFSGHFTPERDNWK